MIDVEELEQRTYELVAEAAYHGNHRLAEALARLGEPLRVAVAGRPQSGKSTLVNALIGEDVAPARASAGPPSFVTYRDGTQPRAWWNLGDGPPYEIPMAHAQPGLRLGPDVRFDATGDRRVLIDWPNRALRRTQLIDTGPGPAPRQIFHEADAVLYLTPQIDEADLRFLEAGRGLRGPAVFPVQVMVVLSRADATAGGRLDALLTAKQIARRRRREPRIGALCQDVVAMSPLLGHAARTLRDNEFRAIAALAALPRPESEPYLLSTDRFTAPDALHPVGAEQRAQLLQRFGLGGVRLAITLARTGADRPATLAERLQEHSGLTDLQASISELFTARRALLKARSALTVLDHVLRTEQVPQSGALLARLELLVAEAHEFRELRLLSALRAGRVTLPAENAAEARRLLGGSGTSVGERLGVPPEASPDQTWAAADAAANRWRAETHHRGQTPAQRRAAEVVLRSCDTILVSLDQMTAQS